MGEDRFFLKVNLESDDFLDLMHEFDIPDICFSCIVCHDWPYFLYEELFTFCLRAYELDRKYCMFRDFFIREGLYEEN